MQFDRLFSAALAFGWLAPAGIFGLGPLCALAGENHSLPGTAGSVPRLVVVSIWEPAPAPQDVSRVYREELQSILGDLGIPFQQVSFDQATQRSFAGRIVVVRLHQSRAEARTGSPKIPAIALGWTHASDGDITPFSAIDLEGLRRFVRIPDAGHSTPKEEAVLARAAARVAAHEIFHMLTRSAEHSVAGLMKEALSASELCAPVSPHWTNRNREAAGLAMPGRRNGVLAAVSAGQSLEADRR